MDIDNDPLSGLAEAVEQRVFAVDSVIDRDPTDDRLSDGNDEDVGDLRGDSDSDADAEVERDTTED